MTEPTRAELEAAAIEALRLVQWEFWGNNPDPIRVGERLDAYGAACQALGEHIGRQVGPRCKSCGADTAPAAFCRDITGCTLRRFALAEQEGGRAG